jgi:hypothetical protein
MIKEDIIFNEAYTFDPNNLDKARTISDFVALWNICEKTQEKINWYKGDLLKKLSVIHGEGSTKIFALKINQSHQSIDSYRRVARAFPIETRIYNLSWTHYFMASFTDKYLKGKKIFSGNRRFEWLQQAEENKWSSNKLQKQIEFNEIPTNESTFQKINHCIEQLEGFSKYIKGNSLKDNQIELINKILDITDLKLGDILIQTMFSIDKQNKKI